MANYNPLRLAVIGGNRGFAYTGTMDLLKEQIELVAVCDLDESVFGKWKERYPEIRTSTSYEQILDDSTIDAVFIATPMLIHAKQSVQAMKAGKHVLCEVSSAHTVEDCWELVETVEQTGRVYMMAENFCYTRMNMMIRNMSEKGMFGEITHAECGYIHDVRTATNKPDGNLLWRGEMLRDYNGINYPTHSLGPIAQWIGINQLGGDSFDYITTVVSKPASQCDYFAELFGKDHPGAKPEFWKQGDSALALIRTKKGAVIYMRNDFSSPRPFNYKHHALQGTKGSLIPPRHEGEEPLVWFNSRSSEKSYHGTVTWTPAWDYVDEFEHPWWQRSRQQAEQAAAFGDYFIMEEFAAAIREGRSPEMDVYDSVAISSVFPLSVASAAANGQPVSFPDFARNKFKAVKGGAGK
ncbi:Gfo/Idh/MocA family protein [Paenibacillus eucommiae]|uniref:Dehydrogenase n=1 Tax=Paenibacillus eucommiae TaxID=1355755 RepID=A0ABS4IM32_9BACL|nr:Gfo/Idh/MocA family oxidoreductase [Paenibacillus eucommiae]MBP1988620.1 putative dehydrogenase [Paenibacillus eucommiae]